jgi:hypothetical protein
LALPEKARHGAISQIHPSQQRMLLSYGLVQAYKEIRRRKHKGEKTMLIILLVILLLLSVGSFPSWPYSRGWGYYPSGGLGLVLLILVILLLLGRI